ncbi:MAG TPA: VOC family protein [Frankiaceae bacterium]|jgi:catechol 2,3-dioxygenase-like lactoylglutathione lyase family enzyme|nr:VOC family protein [Frankiaceae bacterium]
MNHLAGLAAVAIDCADPPRLAQWWHGLLGGRFEVDFQGDAELHVDGFPRLDFLRVPDAKTTKNRLHLDLLSEDFDKAVEAALAHGATKANDVFDHEAWQVLRDIEGNEFCILRPRTD